MPVRAMPAEWVLEAFQREMVTFLEGLSHRCAATIIYGNEFGGITLEPVSFAQFYCAPEAIAA